jgi:membrane peptidoglycan carboxypeptidase
MLEGVVTDGTAKSSKLEGYTAAGKTGTAQKIEESTGRYSATKHVASFVGFAPATNPMISIIVMVDEPVGAHHGGDVAAPVFKRIAEQVLRYMTVPPDVPSYAPQYVVKQPKPESKPKRGPVLQPPAAPPTQLVAMHLGEDEELGDVIIPDFHGKSLRQVTEECLKAGLRLQSLGSGAAAEQLPPAGANVRVGSTVQVRFSSKVDR